MLNRTHAKPDKAQETASALIQLIKELCAELHIPSTRLKGLNLDSSFDTHLGLDSLARMEVLSRVENRFGVKLSEQVFADAETPRDLLRAILSAEALEETPTAPEVSAVTLEESQAIPDHAHTLVEVLDWHAQVHPERPHIKLYQDEGEGETITYGALKKGAEAIARGLQQYGLKAGEAVSIMLPTGKEYFFTFFGILIAGGIPVPIYPPARLTQIEDHLLRHKSILTNCQAAMLITVPQAKQVGRLLKSYVGTLHTLITPQELTKATGALLKPKLGPENIAFLQYTSGSTGTPKGVVLTHRNLLSNIRTMGETVQAESSDVFVSWLPLYHDLGLIGAWLGSFHYAMLLVVMSPLSFLAKPSRWLWAIHRYRASFTAAPNFAFALCLKRLAEDLEGLDLSALRVVFNGAEPVSPDTVEKFIEQFGPYGFRRSAMLPVYGLAENSLGLTFPPLNRGPVYDQIERETFMRKGRAVPCQDPRRSLRFVSCGYVLMNHEVRIVDSRDLELPERQQGRLQFKGPSATSGYYRNPEATQRLFHGDWLDSGDLAYMADGEVYITGRVKDLIIHAGRNIYPQELEEAIGDIPGIRKGCIAVFGSPSPESGTERLVVLAETRETDLSAKEKLISEINAITAERIGTPPDEVLLAPPHSVLKTSSGKVRRSACRDLYERRLVGKGTRSVAVQFLHLLLAAVTPQLRSLGQAIGTGLYGLYGWALLLPLATLTWSLVAICPRPAWRWKISRGATKLLTFASGTPVSVQGIEHLPGKDRPSLLISNHASYLDGLILVRTLPMEFSFVAKAELARQFISGVFLRRINAEFVERFDRQRGVMDAKRIAQMARQGRSLLFFPEGTFTRMPGLLPFHMGAFVAAAEAGLPVTPIVIRGTRSILRGGTWFPRRGSISVTISRPIDPKDFIKEGEKADTWSVALKLRDATRLEMLKHVGEPDLAYERSPLRAP